VVEGEAKRDAKEVEKRRLEEQAETKARGAGGSQRIAAVFFESRNC
jgi:hypothetical protein